MVPRVLATDCSIDHSFLSLSVLSAHCQLQTNVKTLGSQLRWTKIMTTKELRQRVPVQNQYITGNMESEQEDVLPQQGSGLAAKSMINSAPQQHGVVLKLHVPLLYSILPEFIQKVILSVSFLAFLGPTWKQRYLILCGSFLYKFKNQMSQVPKGSPFELETIHVNAVSSHGAPPPELGNLPPGFLAIFAVSTLRRQHYYAVADEEEAGVWIRSINEARHETITRNMGHAGGVPYPSTWRYFDTLGRGLLKSKERIREKLEEYNMREMEMANFVEASPMRGFHG